MRNVFLAANPKSQPSDHPRPTLPAMDSNHLLSPTLGTVSKTAEPLALSEHVVLSARFTFEVRLKSKTEKARNVKSGFVRSIPNNRKLRK